MKGHIFYQNNGLYCSHCGKLQRVAMPIEIPVFIALAKAFLASHTHCKKVIAEPIQETDSSLERQQRWLREGERSIAADTIFSFFSGVSLGHWEHSHPFDAMDFWRCYSLLQYVPEWRGRIAEIGILSPAWARLAENWEKLEAMLQIALEKADTGDIFYFIQKITK